MHNNAYPLYAFYDADGVFISKANLTIETQYADYEFDIPENAASVMINALTKSTTYMALSFLIVTSVGGIADFNHWRGKKVVLLGTSVGHGANASESYIRKAAELLGFNFINTSRPGQAIHTNDDGTEYSDSGSTTLSIAEYAAAGETLPTEPLPYIPGGTVNGYYKSYENIFNEATADADLYIFAVAPNNGNFATTDWDAFDKDNWVYTDGSMFTDHRTTFLGAMLFLMDQMYTLNPDARMVLLLDSLFSYSGGKSAFQTISQKWNIPVIDLWAKINTSPKSLAKVKSLDGTNSHPSTFAHEKMGQMLAGELLSIS